MKTIKNVFLLGLLTLWACNNIESEFDICEANNTTISEIETSTEEYAVSNDEISRVIEQFRGNSNQSRTSKYDISPIYGDDNTPIAYVINFQGCSGFMVISATKNYTPILAYSDHGAYLIDENVPIGLSEWQDGVKEIIEYSNALPTDSVMKYRAMWRQYEEPAQTNIQSRALEDEITAAQLIMMDSVTRWQNANMTVSDIPQDGIDDWQMQSEIEEIVRNSIYPLFEEEMYRLSKILHRNQSTRVKIDNFVQSTWNQTGLYNQSFVMSDGSIALAGCGPVAVGQVMRYHEYPATLDWSSMPLTYGSKTTSDFLYAIALRAGATLGTTATSTTLSGLVTALTSYGYSVSTGDHNSSTAWGNVSSGKPLILLGHYYDSNENYVGHAWIASGGECVYGLIQDEVWTFREKTLFECVHSYNTQRSTTYYLYMNWGWGGYSDGYFLDSSLQVPGSASTASNRKMIYNITPGN